METNKYKTITVLIDFDGVLHQYDTEFESADIIPDPPVNGAIEWLEAIWSSGLVVPVIFSARVGFENDRKTAELAMRRWLKKHNFSGHAEIKITDQKLPARIQIDDKAWQFRGQFPNIDQILKFRPWNKQ